MRSKNASYLSIVLLIMLSILLIIIIPRFFIFYKENFSNLSPGEFPDSVSYPILKDDYPLKTPPQLSSLDSEQLYKYNPIYLAKSDKTNNIRYWKSPNNGKCSSAEFCNSMYNEKNIVIPGEPKNPGWDDGIRVNYYISD